MTPAIRDAIIQAAQEAGLDPAFALAVADRESAGDPTAHNSRTIFGLYQMRGPLRERYGAGDSTDPLTQARAWTRFIGDVRNGMAQRLGRAPTDDELYLGHHFGEGRAARMISGAIDPSTSVADVFSPYERSINPHFDRAGTTGNLMASVESDLDRRQARYGGVSRETDKGQAADGVDFAQFGQPDTSDPVQSGGNYSNSIQSVDFAQFGRPVTDGADAGAPAQSVDMKVNTQPLPSAPGNQTRSPDQSVNQMPGTEVDLTQFGLAA